jgi:hypothetical protein
MVSTQMRITILVLMLFACVTATKAKEMTCADYANSKKAFAWCRANDTHAGLENCCAGAAAWKAACDVFHVHAESHADASALVNSTEPGRRAAAKDFAECVGNKH